MEQKRTTPIKAIRLKCLDCCCGNPYEVKECAAEKCALYPYRMGKNPNIGKRELTDEQRETLKSRVALARLSKHQEKSKN